MRDDLEVIAPHAMTVPRLPDLQFTAATLLLCCVAAAPWAPGIARGQGGPPYLTNDPGTPGNANWEINIASVPAVGRGAASYQVPQIDLNYGIGDRIQLTYEVPYLVQTGTGQSTQGGWSNANPGVKLLFLDQGEEGWQLSTFPQVETGGSALAQQRGLASPGPRLLLPLEAAHKVGPVDLDFEVGYYFPRRGPREQILGVVVGRSLNERLEVDAEIYHDRAMGASPDGTTLDVGGRYKLARGFVALFMAGRNFSTYSTGQPEFVGYFGIQILLSDYGRTLASDP